MKNFPMSGDPKRNRWYKDRDFPEVKSGNDSIIATVTKPEELLELVLIHNELLDELDTKDREISRLKFLLEALEENNSRNYKYFDSMQTRLHIMEAAMANSHALRSSPTIGLCYVCAKKVEK